MTEEQAPGQSAETQHDEAPAAESQEAPAQEEPQPAAQEEPAQEAEPPARDLPWAISGAGTPAESGEPPMAAWPPNAEPPLYHRYLLTAPGDDGDAALDLAGATPYANFSESREGPNGTTWLASVSEADSANFLAQAANAGHTVQELAPDGASFTHVLGDEGTGWMMPGDQPAAQDTEAEDEPEDEAKDEDEPGDEAKDEDESEPAAAKG